MPDIPLVPVALTASIIAGITSLLYLREFFLRKKNARLQQKISLETRQKSIQILNAAEMAETHVISEGNYATQKLISEFKVQLADLMQNSEKSLDSSQEELVKFLAELQRKSEQFQQASSGAIEKRVNQMFEKLESRLADFLVTTEQKTTSSIELELKAARNLIETYKDQQLKLIDENIIAMMEQTLNIVLAKKLSLKDQLDLVYEALEKAKVEKFVA